MKPDFSKGNGLLPVIVQDATTMKVLMLGYMNEEAFRKTQEDRKVTFYSRSKERLWVKGETSGNFLIVDSLTLDCDNDAVLVKAHPQGPTCHTGADTCFNESNEGNVHFISFLEGIIKDRKTNPTDESYVSSLFKKGINKIAQKVGEEAVEVVIEAKDDNDELFSNEAADLLFHLLILLEEKNIPLSQVLEVLKKRHKPVG